MVSTITINPILTSNASGSFQVESTGQIQGCALDDPAIRNALKGGYLDPLETLPMWGGVGITTLIPPLAAPAPSGLGQSIRRATSVGPATSGTQAYGPLTGFSVFNQDHSMINSPQSPVPLAAAYMSVHWYQLGSRARIPVQIDPALVNLEGALTASLVSWDFALQRLIPYNAAFAANVFTALTRAATGPGGTYVATATTTTNHGIAVGSDFTVSGQTPTAYNGTWKAITGTATNQLVWNLGTTTDPGASTVLGQVNAGGGAAGKGVTGGGILPVDILDVEIGNSMTVNFDPVTGYATWNRQGSVAIIQV